MKVTVCRKEHFNAAHRLYNPQWNDQKNNEVFGKCNNPNYHGHNYELEVKLTGDVDPDTGYVFDMKTLSEIIKENIISMFDHKNLNLRRERNSTAWLVDLVWQIARASGHGTHFLDQTTVIEDDHVPFVQAGVPAVDLIDLDYGPGNRYWHTPDDTVDKVSARSMEIVGEVVLKTVERLGRRWPGQNTH